MGLRGQRFEKMEDKNFWYVIYTKSRHERVLADQLREAGYTVYLPMIKKERIWSDRKKLIETPLFTSYVFIKGISEKWLMKGFSGFVTFLKYNNKPGIVRQEEINILKTIIKHGYDINEAGDIKDLHEGSKVMVIGGPLKGMIGNLLSVSDNDWLLIHFENLGNSIQVKIPSNFLKKI